MAVEVAVVGASGYTGLELVRRLAGHARVKLTNCYCRTPDSWRRLAPHLLGLALPPLEPLAALKPQRVLFFCLPHTRTAAAVADVYRESELIIDLSADFRLNEPRAYEEYYDFTHPAPLLLKEAVYALVERVDWSKYSSAADKDGGKLMAVPGCYPTACLLPLLPLLEAGAVDAKGIVINALSGLSGAGRSPKPELSFCENAESVRAYAVGRHRHLAEIEQELTKTAGAAVRVTFTPHLVPMNRGLYATITARRAEGDPQKLLEAAYRNSEFVHIVEEPPTTSQVRGTNHCHISARVVGETVVINSAIDNLVKGAAGQAIQAMNSRLGIRENEGLTEPGRVP